MNLKVGTFNLYQFVAPPFSFYQRKDKFTKEKWLLKTTWIKEQILKMNCDVIGFQEVFSHKELEELVSKLGFKYFEIVQEAKTRFEHDTIFITTTLAIASKYPITSIEKIKTHAPSIKRHNFQGHFKFKRKPIKAIIKLNNEHEFAFYVCHLKSNRLNEYEHRFTKNDTLEKKLIKLQESLKNNFSPALQQRLCEASSIFFDLKKEKRAKILVCDLNDREYSLTIEALTNINYHQNKDELLLYDTYHLIKKVLYNPHPEQKEIQRVATSYYQNKGNVLDYIFVSKEFLKTKQNSKMQVNDYDVFDKHLQENSNGSLLKSDHAQVVCEIGID